MACPVIGQITYSSICTVFESGWYFVSCESLMGMNIHGVFSLGM
jgi:hypothetical protein